MPSESYWAQVSNLRSRLIKPAALYCSGHLPATDAKVALPLLAHKLNTKSQVRVRTAHRAARHTTAAAVLVLRCVGWTGDPSA